MNKILKINFQDIVYDQKNASRIINKACSRNYKMIIAGGFVKGGNLILSLEEADAELFEKIDFYVIAPFDEVSETGIIAEITSRYYAGFSTIICFPINNRMWGVFSKKN